MNRNTKKILIIIFAVLIPILIGFTALVVHNYQTKTSFKYSKKNAEELKPAQNKQDIVSKTVSREAKKAKNPIIRRDDGILTINEEDFVLGSEEAKVTMFEYASLSCPHCASFYREAFEKLKEEYIDSGKVKFVFRNFPLNQPALSAAMFASCRADGEEGHDIEKYHEILTVLFKSQDSWAFDASYKEKLEAIAKLDGMEEEDFQTCMANSSLQTQILSARMLAAKGLKIRSVPTFFINGEILEGYIDYRTIRKLIEKKLEEAEDEVEEEIEYDLEESEKSDNQSESN